MEGQLLLIKVRNLPIVIIIVMFAVIAHLYLFTAMILNYFMMIRLHIHPLSLNKELSRSSLNTLNYASYHSNLIYH